MDEYTIQINYSRANRQAEELENAANELKMIANSKMEQSCSSIGRNWQGENADKYLHKMRTVQNDILTVSRDLKNTAQSIRRIARITYDADMAALRIAQNRNV